MCSMQITLDTIMEQVQVYAEVYSLIASKYDSGDMCKVARKEREELKKKMIKLLVREPLTDKQVDLGANNLDPGDWNHPVYRTSWYDGFKVGARFAEEEHNIENGNS